MTIHRYSSIDLFSGLRGGGKGDGIGGNMNICVLSCYYEFVVN